MKAEYIAIIVVVGVWLIVLLITGLLALKYQAKHNAYQKVSDDYQKEYQQLQQNFDAQQQLLPIETNIKLPTGEYFYAIEHKVSVFGKTLSKKKKKNSTKISRKEMKADYEDYYGIINLKKIYSLASSEFKMKYPTILGDMFITNKQVLFKEKNNITSIKLKDIKSVKFSVIYVDKFFYPGFSIISEDTTYQIINQNPESIIIINALIDKIKQKQIESDSKNNG